MPVDLVARMLDGHRNGYVGVTAEEGPWERSIVISQCPRETVRILPYLPPFYITLKTKQKQKNIFA